jgi:hypothetical protein
VAQDEDDATLAWQMHAEAGGCPQSAEQNAKIDAVDLPAETSGTPDGDVGPDDLIGTVRAAHGWIAVRTYTVSGDDSLAWFIIDVGANGELPGYPLPMDQMTLDELSDTVAGWPIVYQP